MPPHVQDQVQLRSLTEPESFWAHQADRLHWHKKPSRTLQTSETTLADSRSYPHWSWFPDGEISTCYNCLDRHVLSGHGESTAIIWDSPVTSTKQTFTYRDVLAEVETLAGVLREEGVRRGDVVLVYMPMIPAALFACLAISRLGAIHAVVFGGFAAPALAQRIEASTPRVIMTSSCGVEGAKGLLDYKPFILGAIEQSHHKPEKVIIWQREQRPWLPVVESRGERDWQRLVEDGKRRGLRAEAVPVGSNEGLYIIYTSGTTGLPKGVLREAGGHAVGLSLSIRYLFGVHGPGDVMFCASDIGWVVGHSYILYAPLLVGATTVLFEGKPVGTPDASTFWRIISEHRVNALFTAPTALRAIRREDPTNRHLTTIGQRDGLRSLRALYLAGERSEPALISMYQSLLTRYAAPNALVIDNWWSSESGSPISGISLAPDSGLHPTPQTTTLPLAIRPGSAGKAMPGFSVHIVSDTGASVPAGQMGNIVLRPPLAPTGFTTLWRDATRFYDSYLSRFDGAYLDTGDAGMIDHDGYIHVMSRSDDIINVAAHRFSTGSIEQAIASHPSVAECCVVGIPDELKGHLPFAFITLSTPQHPSSAVMAPSLQTEIQARVRDQIGAIARLGGIVQGKGMIPKTRSGKTLRRVLRALVENAVEGEWDREVGVPATVEDAAVVEVARVKIREYFDHTGAGKHRGVSKL